MAKIRRIPPLHRWMGSLPDRVSLSQLSIPGTHNSVARNTVPLAECQTQFLKWQLRNGIRYLDIRCASTERRLPKDSKQDPWFFNIFHGVLFLGRTFDEVLNTCLDFLSQNPKETIIMRVQQEYSTDSERYKNIFLRYIIRYGAAKFYVTNTIPSLAQARGKIVLLTSWPYLGMGLEFRLQEVQDEYDNPEVDDKLKLVIDHINASITHGGQGKFYINHLSATGSWLFRRLPFFYAEKLNPYINKQLRGQFKDKRQLGIIVYDYAGYSVRGSNNQDTHLAQAIIIKNHFVPPYGDAIP